MALRRLILTIKPDGHELRVLHRSKAGPMAYTAHGMKYGVDGIHYAPHGCEVREDTLSAGPPYFASLRNNSRTKKGA